MLHPVHLSVCLSNLKMENRTTFKLRGEVTQVRGNRQCNFAGGPCIILVWVRTSVFSKFKHSVNLRVNGFLSIYCILCGTCVL